MLIPSLLAHAATGQWCVTPEELHRLQALAARAYAAPLGERASYFSDEDVPTLPAPELFQTVGDIAVIEINGVLGKNLDPIDCKYFGGVDYDDICERINAAEQAGPRAICFHTRSPGGMALGAAECGDRIARISQPTFAYTDFLACSGGYWLASQCDEVFCSGSALLGSIGVLAAYLDQSKALETIGFKVNAFSAGKWKLAGASFKPMTDEEREMFQARVDRYYSQFTAAVNRGRKIADEHMQGQVFDGAQAVEAGLADGIFSSLDECLAALTQRER